MEAAAGSGLSVTGVTDIGPQYAVTIRAWRAAWEARRAEALKLGYSLTFWRKYRREDCSIYFNIVTLRFFMFVSMLLDPILRSLPTSPMRTTCYYGMYARHDMIIRSASLWLEDVTSSTHRFSIPSRHGSRAKHEKQVGCRFYFAYCEAAFDARYIRNYQIVWRKTAEPATAVLSAINADLAAAPAPADPMTQVTGFKILCIRDVDRTS